MLPLSSPGELESGLPLSELIGKPPVVGAAIRSHRQASGRREAVEERATRGERTGSLDRRFAVSDAED